MDDTAHVAVTVTGEAAEAVGSHSPALVADAVASRIAAKDFTLWGEEAEAESKIRLGWTELFETARGILPQLDELVAAIRAEGKDRIVLAGMGGSSLGPEVICATYDVPLVTLDSTDPDQVRDALDGDLESTVLVVSSKSGGTVETDSQRRAFEYAFEQSGLDPRQHIVVVTDPGSPLHKASVDAGYRAVFLADPNVGGRFSVLSAFGIVPSALAGVPVVELLDEAAAVADSFAEDNEANPAIVLGAAMGGTSRDKLVFSDVGSGLVGFADWAEQLIAESTGKSGVGILPVVAEADAPDAGLHDVLDVRLAPLDEEIDGPENGIIVAGTLGGQFLLWEYATSIASRLLHISPFDQPNVESAKAASRKLLDALPEPEAPLFVDNGIEVRATDIPLDGVTTVAGAVAALEAQLGERGYVAVMAYLDRQANPALASVRGAIAARTQRPVTFGWGPRFLHSTGQLHKGGAPIGVFLQITSSFEEDLEIPARPFTFGQLISAQAQGDAAVLAEHSRPVLRLNLTDAAQIDAVAAILKG
ncbi:MAG: glucose-6-phosphate isomerase [Demequina sp.]